LNDPNYKFFSAGLTYTGKNKIWSLFDRWRTLRISESMLKNKMNSVFKIRAGYGVETFKTVAEVVIPIE
jgi:hypothetical protein